MNTIIAILLAFQSAPKPQLDLLQGEDWVLALRDSCLTTTLPKAECDRYVCARAHLACPSWRECQTVEKLCPGVTL